MDDNGRIKIVSGIDIIITIFLIIIGILVCIVGFGLVDSIGDSYGQPDWMWAFPWFVLMLGITSIIYSIKRLIDNILKINIASNPARMPPQRMPPQQRVAPPAQQMSQQNPYQSSRPPYQR